jgi:murein DD-endopeptidase MepM/ murein hydrolase activator NlpD
MARQYVVIAVLALGACAQQQPQPGRRAVAADVLLEPEIQTIQSRVPARATLDSLLRQHRLSGEVVEATVAAARRVFNPRGLRAERPYRLVLSIDGLLREFEYQIDADTFLRIVNPDRDRPAVLDAKVLPIEKQVSVAAIRGQISKSTPSLIAALGESGERVELAMALAEIFGGEIDFNNDLQPGDAFELLFEKSTHEGEFAGYGSILGARFTSGSRELRAFRWVDPASGKPGYYDGDGRSLRRQLLSSPLRFEPRITSGFSRSRFHPVHHEYRAHLGVDYGAPYGSSVVAVADGVVVSAGWAGGGGNTVHLKHAGGLETYYLHLSSFAKGIRAGMHVSQNQVIGRVGATGTATGPHLDYRMKRGGNFVNPVTAHRQQPPGEPIRTRDMAEFRQARDVALQRLTTILFADAAPARPDAVRASQ